MSLQGDVNTLSLADLVQVCALNRRTCQVHVVAPHAEGDLFLEQGEVVHAWWGDLVGAEAVYAMLNTPDVGFHVRDDVTVAAQTIAADWQQLVLEAARRCDHDLVPRPRVRSSDRWRYDTPVPMTEPATVVRPRSAPPRVLWLTATALLALAVGMLAAKLFRPRNAATAAALPAAASASVGGNGAVVDASELTGAGDALPTLAEGAPPTLPRSEWAVAPTIVCRLTIGADGRVVQSRIWRSRLDLGAFEDAALSAVEGWRFHPARRAGAPVAVTINWPVRFSGSDARTTRLLRIKGSDTIGGALGPALGGAFHAAHADVEVGVEALGSKTAFVGLFDGSADLGASSRPVDADELAQAARLGVTLREYVLAYDGIAVVVHPSNAQQQLSLDELAQIFSGKVRDWSAVGGASGPITVLVRPSYSGTQSFFRDKVLRRGDKSATDDFAPDARVIEDNKELLAAVADDPSAIAFIGHGWLGPAVRALPIAIERGGPAVLPETATIRDGSYPIYRPLLFYTRGAPTRDAAAFLSFALGPDGQALVREHGFVPIDAPATVPVAADDGPEGAPIEPVRITFNAGGSKLADDARARLASLARHARGAQLLVVGHSDAEGNRVTNHHLALRRAERVAATLQALGVPPAAISIEADDSDAPVATNRTQAGRRQNRRADVFLLRR